MKTQIFRGWAMVAVTHVLFALIFGSTYALGVLLEPIQQSFQSGRFSASAVFAITAFIYYLLGLVSGALADRFSTRWIVGLGMVLLAAGFALGSQAGSLPMLLWSFCALVGAGVGLVYIPSITVVQRWFVRQRSRASGLALAGTGLGTFTGPVLASWLLQSMDWRSTMLYFALGIAVLGLLASSQIVGQPAALGLRPDGDAPPPPGATHNAPGWELGQALRSGRFWWYFSSIFLASIGLFVALVHIVPCAHALGVPPTRSSLLIGLIGIGNVLGRLLLGGLGDRLGPRRLLLWLTVALALLNGLWLLAGAFWSLAVFALLFGAANGGCIALYPALAADWFGTRRLGAILGALYTSVGLAALVGASAAGLLFDVMQSYTLSIAASGLLALVAVVCLLAAMRSQARTAVLPRLQSA